MCVLPEPVCPYAKMVALSMSGASESGGAVLELDQLSLNPRDQLCAQLRVQVHRLLCGRHPLRRFSLESYHQRQVPGQVERHVLVQRRVVLVEQVLCVWYLHLHFRLLSLTLFDVCFTQNLPSKDHSPLD